MIRAHAGRPGPARPICTVVIAAYNAAATICQALDSVLAQSRQDFEVIVVDDGSTDGTAERAARHLADLRFRIHRQRNAGPAAARNAGIGLARGRYVAMLDSDDLWLPHYLERMVEALEHSEGPGFAFTRAWVLDRATSRFRKQPWSPRARATTDPQALLGALIEANFVFNSVTIRRTVLRAVGGYDPAILASEDYELWLRLAARGHGAAYVPGPLCICSDRPGSLSHDPRRMAAGLCDTYRKLLAHERLAPDTHARARDRLVSAELDLDRLCDPARPTLSATARARLADATRGWRQRRKSFDRLPAELAAVSRSLQVRSR
jgi:cellulose synthase/poly-beta-1,6-N-acetylglucosamine synthase-like glycosyltransferase